MQSRFHLSKFDLDQVHLLREPRRCPFSTRIPKKLDSPEERPVSRLMPMHRFARDFMLDARPQPFPSARMEIRIMLGSTKTNTNLQVRDQGIVDPGRQGGSDRTRAGVAMVLAFALYENLIARAMRL